MVAGTSFIASSRVAGQRFPLDKPPGEIMTEIRNGRDHDAYRALTGSAQYHRIGELLDSLEAQALNNAPPRLRRTAVWMISSAGSSPSSPAAHGAFARLARVFARSSNIEVKRVSLTGMTRLVERDKVLSFLDSLARMETNSVADRWLPEYAVMKLGEVRPGGEAVLRRLHAENAVKDPRARLLAPGILKR